MPRKTERFGAAQGLGSILEREKRRIYDDAAPAKREAFLEAERVQEVYRAWNTVCARTREGQHVCGLHFVPETRELIVYVDGSSWVNELTVLREIIRARMEACGVSVSALVFKLSRKGYETARASRSIANKGASPIRKPVPLVELSSAESDAIDASVARIKDEGLQRALKSAMGAGLSLDKGRKSTK